ncbi:MAG: lytic transglycosylase domain-containing protein [Planctomycetota bacterium]
MSGLVKHGRWNDLLRRAAGNRWAWVGLLSGLLVVIWAGPDAARWVWHAGDAHRIDQYTPLMREHADAAGMDLALVRAVVMAESSGRADAVSPANAKGLMQITAITEQDVLQRNPDLKRGDLFDPDYNLQVGTTYLGYLLRRFDGDETLALAAYHMGPTRVRRIQREHPGITPQQLVADHAGPKTRAYVNRVLSER